MGESAGGHLAALVGLTAHRSDLEGTHGVVGPSSAVDVVVDWYGPADFTTMPRMQPPPHIAAKLEPAMLRAAGGPADPGAGGCGPRRRQPDHPRDAGRAAVPAGPRHGRLAGALRAERAAARRAHGRRASTASSCRSRTPSTSSTAATTSTPSSGCPSTTSLKALLAMSDLTVLPVTVEHHREPIGIGEATPRLSWVSRTDLPDWRQAAYELEIGEDWSSGRVDSGESVLVPWDAPPLTSRERRTVRVRVWGDGRRRAVGLERGRRRRGRAARAGGLDGAAGGAAAARAGRRRVSRSRCCAASSRSTSR